MPKNNRKSKANHVNDVSDDEYSNDGASVYSYQSDHVTPESTEEMVAENIAEKYEEKLMMAIENASEKSQQTRINALQAMSEILMHHCMYDFIDERRITIMDLIEKSLKRGKGQEQALAAKLAALLIIQLQGEEDIVKTLAPLLQMTALDKSASFDARAKSCLSLALSHFLLGSDDTGDTIQLCQLFESIFAGSFLKGDNSPSSASADAAILHAAALSSWALLITLISPGDLVSMVGTKEVLGSFKSLMGLLQSQHLEVRTTAGEAIALLLECGRIHDDEFLDNYIEDLTEITQQLATDSQKFRAKRDRKQQRATFRDVLHYIEEEIQPDIQVQVGAGVTKETLVLESWAMNHHYNVLCNILGSGMHIHLLENDLLRDIFEMGVRLDASQVKVKLSKNEKRAIQAASFKARTLTRGKNRDKRSAVVN
ncbi:hypothetical protein PVAND_003889 [Polypedilum vanderplanki]|uniref:Interferon-related developmental regulator n=1 Tax=Polypedilum vanderplanki TaxID=319348 RepID=A0A9J6BVY3_POLVA|nr:hypothetical protein PVAND_003889 [Polypedilum vanderplanki]